MDKRKALIVLCLLIVVTACAQAGEDVVDGDDDRSAQLPIPSGAERGELVPCSSVEDPTVTHLEVLQAPSFPEPEPGVFFVDPVFGTCIVRVTDRNADPLPDDPSPGLKNEYSRVQSFNADGSLLVVYGTEGSWYLYDARSLAPIGEIPIGVEPRWDADDPNLLYYFEDVSLLRYDIRTGETSRLHDFRADFPDLSLAAVWTRYEGSPSWDGRYWGLMGQDQDWEVVVFLVYDLQENRVVAERRLPGGAEVDSVAISPLGTYFLAFFDNYCERGNPGDDRNPCGLMVYDRNLEYGRSLVRIIGHSDPALDPQGREVLVYQGIDSDTISMLDLASGEVTELWPIDFSHTAIGLHFSGHSFQAPGWVLVSTYGDDARAHTWMDNAIFAVELRLNGRVVRLAHTHSLVDDDQDHDYWAEPHASVNHDFTRILFTSNWGRSGTGAVDMYLIELPPGWINRLP
jgi:hypothetical protein